MLSHESLRVDTVSSLTLATNDSASGQPIDIAVAGKWLVVLRLRGNPYLHLHDRQTGGRVLAFGQRGKLPGEFSETPLLFHQEFSGGLFWVQDGLRQRFLAFRMSAWDSGGNGFDHAFDYAGRWIGYPPVMLGPDTAFSLVTKKSGESQFAKVLKNGQTFYGGHFVRDFRFGGRELLRAYDYSLCLAPSRGMIAITYLWAGRIDFVDESGIFLHTAKVPFPFAPIRIYGQDSTLARFDDNNPGTREGYGACAPGRRFLYVRFDGRRRVKGEPPFDHSYVHVFDWSGALVRVLRLDHRARALAVDPEERHLYTIFSPPGRASEIRVTPLSEFVPMDGITATATATP